MTTSHIGTDSGVGRFSVTLTLRKIRIARSPLIPCMQTVSRAPHTRVVRNIRPAGNPGEIADAQRSAPRETTHSRCRMAVGRCGCGMWFERRQIDGTLAHKVRGHAGTARISRQLRWHDSDGGSYHATRMRMVRLLRRSVDHRRRTVIWSGKRTTADAGGCQPGRSCTGRGHRGEWRTSTYPSGCSALPLRPLRHRADDSSSWRERRGSP